MRNERWSWGAESAELNALFLRVWRHEIGDGQVQVLNENRAGHSAGFKERQRHIGHMHRDGRAYGVVCTAVDEHAVPRSIASFEREILLELGTPYRRTDGYWFAPVRGEITSKALHRLATGPGTREADIADIHTRSLPPTTRDALVAARRGQGRFRRELLKLWDNCCAVTGCSVTEALRASHAKPWRRSSDAERLDPHNGLPLLGTLDALFDAGLIGFDAQGEMKVSARLNASQRAELDLPRNLRREPRPRCGAYLEAHLAAHFH